jgi:LacI family transcriptional regulator
VERRRRAARHVKRIALIYDATRAYDVKVMTGVAAYLQGSDPHSIYIEESALKDQRLPDLRSWDGDGIIADFDDPKVSDIVTQSGLPAVGFGGGYGWYEASSRIPYFYTNNVLIAAQAADHLLERGFKHLAYCGYPPSRINVWSAEREEAFVGHLARHGMDVAVFRCGAAVPHEWAALQQMLREWLQTLPKPAGVMTANDSRGREVLEACRAAGLRVPAEVAVVGVDNDELLCQLSSPPLTSVEQGAKGLGFAAAAMLDRLMKGEQPAQLHFVIDPVGVIARLSTDILAVQDPEVARAMTFIREHAGEPIGVRDVVRTTAVSRSTLEARFRKALHCTIGYAIRRAHLDRARHLISETRMPLKHVAVESGFKSVQHMTTSFHRAFAQPPARYRRAH